MVGRISLVMIRRSGYCSNASLAASIPSISGIAMSSITMSGRPCSSKSKNSCPLDASPLTSKHSNPSTSIRKPFLNNL